jgi:hypothetical protein
MYFCLPMQLISAFSIGWQLMETPPASLTNPSRISGKAATACFARDSASS